MAKAPRLLWALIDKDIQVVIQGEITGCGIAATAALAGLSYAEAKKKASNLGVYAADTPPLSETKYVIQLLGGCGISASPKEAPFES
ncbi:hypothetical protein, partial [Marinobacter psychrophilus]|jgi:hypothetical protein|uniref:hypothetical protein n=1 Tax=Marinobacter psychrophilus TaxID=330734 RepID=UPI0006542DDE